MVIAVIPSRYHSTRYPGKALATLRGVPLVTRVAQGVRRSGVADEVLVATDDGRIAEAARAGGAEVWLSREAFRTGSDRVAAAVAACWPAASLHHVVINVQGDEPLVGREVLAGALGALEGHDIGTVAFAGDSATERDGGSDGEGSDGDESDSDESDSDESDTVKVRLDERLRRAVDFSRRPLGEPRLVHVGVYAFTRASLSRFTGLPSSARELEEGLEQLRALEAGLTIGVRVVETRSCAVNRPEDLARVEAML